MKIDVCNPFFSRGKILFKTLALIKLRNIFAALTAWQQSFYDEVGPAQ